MGLTGRRGESGAAGGRDKESRMEEMDATCTALLVEFHEHSIARSFLLIILLIVSTINYALSIIILIHSPI